MPLWNSLSGRYAVASRDFANAHPWIGNYFMMTPGTVLTNDEVFLGTVEVGNIVREFNARKGLARLHPGSFETG